MTGIGRRKADKALTLGLGAMFLAAGIYAVLLPWKAAVLPVMLAILGVALSVGLLRQFGARASGTEKPAFAPEDVETYIWYLAATGAVLLCGFEIGGFVFSFAYFRWSGRFSCLVAVALAAPVPVAAYLALDVLLGRPGFDGLLGWLL